MKGVELYGRVRYAVQIEGLSRAGSGAAVWDRPADGGQDAGVLGAAGYRRKKPPARPKLDPFTGIIDGISGDDKVAAEEAAAHLEADLRAASRRARLHRRHHDREGLRAGWRQRAQEMFVPLPHPPGHAQADFGEAVGVIGGVERKIHFFASTCRTRTPASCRPIRRRRRKRSATATFAAFAFFGGVPQSILYDNTKLAVARILGDGTRQRTRVFTELQSHYLFADRFGRPGKGNDKGKVEGLVGYARRNFLVPVPVFGELRGAERASAGALPPPAG